MRSVLIFGVSATLVGCLAVLWFVSKPAPQKLVPSAQSDVTQQQPAVPAHTEKPRKVTKARQPAPWNVNDNMEHRFRAQIGSRTGIVYEDLFLRPAGNNQWMMACRIGTDVLKCQQPDSYWPRDQHGQPIFD